MHFSTFSAFLKSSIKILNDYRPIPVLGLRHKAQGRLLLFWVGCVCTMHHGRVICTYALYAYITKPPKCLLTCQGQGDLAADKGQGQGQGQEQGQGPRFGAFVFVAPSAHFDVALKLKLESRRQKTEIEIEIEDTTSTAKCNYRPKCK
jgi:hypothetical protein